ncbi:DEK C terminal domain [Musa troglodytarum]|uniref:DEK C terminal domain n=1 Tax=Musa troglodytarum TaxID=320322 RepID=A0A9E7HVH7_9LILI|nr:DEK C terminal domain [Musa troglodytarum]
MEEHNSTSDVEGRRMANGCGPSPEHKISVVVDSEKKENTGKNDEVEGTTMVNGSGPPPEGKSVVSDSGRHADEGKSVEEEKHGEQKMNSVEKEHDVENGTTKSEGMEETEEDRKTTDLNTAKAEDVKMADTVVEKGMEVEDVKMVNAVDLKDEEGEKDEEEEGVEKEAKDEEVGIEGEREVGEEGAEEKDNDMEEGNNGSTEKKVDEDKEAARLKRKRTRGQNTFKKGEGKEGLTKSKDFFSPVTSSIERPVRERKTVERLVEVIEKESSREFQVEKGRGTPLKDIPNVAHKLAKKKPADIKLIHQTLFGRRGKAVNFKNHILQFSGFVWHESDEKQRAKMKEKLDKYVKDTLLDLCDLFDLPASKANTKKEDLVVKLLDFLVAPHPTNEGILSEDKQSTKSRKRKRVAQGSGSKSIDHTHNKISRKKQTKSEETLSEEDKSAQEMDNEDDIKNEGEKSESEEASEEDAHDEEDSGKVKQDKKKTSKQGSVGKEKMGSSSKKVPTPATTKSPTQSSSKRSKAEYDDDIGAKVFFRKKRTVDSPVKKSTPRSDKKEKDTGKKVAKSKAKSEAEHPSKEELREKICEILKEVDFNTATFTDILKQLATHYKVDLTPRKASIKLLIQEELTKLAEVAQEDEDDEDEEDAGKEENPQPAGKKARTRGADASLPPLLLGALARTNAGVAHGRKNPSGGKAVLDSCSCLRKSLLSWPSESVYNRAKKRELFDRCMADSDNESGGHSNSKGGAAAREQDRFLPIANVSRIMKKALPANAKISKDAKETVQECVSEFISFVTGEASDKCQREKRKTINGDDLLWAMTTLGFEDYVEPLKVYLQRFREMEGEKAGGAAAASSQSQPKDVSNAGGGPSTSVGGGGTYGGGMMMMGQQMYGTGPPSALQPFQHHQMTMGGINSLSGGGGADGGSPSSGSRQRHDRM